MKIELFTEKAIPHWVFGGITAVWGYFQIALHGVGVPGEINQGWAACLGLWFGYLISQQSDQKVEQIMKDKGTQDD